MYQSFSVLAIEPLTKNKQINIITNADIDQNDFKNVIIELFERETRTLVVFSPVIDEKQLTLNLKDWPIPNTEYILSVKGLKSVIGEELDVNIKKKIVFKSNVISKVSILSPSMFEEIESLVIDLKEKADKEEELMNSIYIEIARDNAFHDTIIKTITKKESLKIKLSHNDQYFLRARAQETLDADEYGVWSDVVTFTMKNEKLEPEIEEEEEEEKEDVNDLTPDIDLEDFKLLTEIEQGVTPKSLILEFNKDIDELSLENIIIIRKVVK